MSERVEVLEIDLTDIQQEAEETGKTLKDLRKEVKELRAQLENTEVGTEGFAKALDELTRKQQELTNITKSGVKAQKGSYNDLVNQMALLKKEWRSTADESERAAIGEKIGTINAKLKELDASLGNYQRNVGNYQGEMHELATDMDAVSGAASSATPKLDSYNSEVGDLTKSTEGLTMSSSDWVATAQDSVKVAAGMTGAFQAVQGAINLMGIESEATTEMIARMQNIMAITQGFQAIAEGVESFNKLRGSIKATQIYQKLFAKDTQASTIAVNANTVAIKGSTTAAKGLKKALIATGIGALVVALGTLIANWDKISKLWNNTTPQEKAAESLRNINYEVNKMANETAAKNIVRLKELKREYSTFSEDLDKKKKFVEEYSGELETMGIMMNNVNDADDIFIDRTDDYIEALKKRAKADALKQKATENYKKGLDIIADAEQELLDKIEDTVGPADNPIDKIKQLFGIFQIATGTFDDDFANDIAEAKSLMESQFDALWAEAEKLEKEADTEMYGSEEERKKKEAERKANEDAKKAAEDAKKAAAEAKRTREQELAEAKQLAERARQAVIDTKQEELAELKRIYDEELAQLKKFGIDTTNLTEEYLKKQTDIELKYYQFEGRNEEEELANLQAFYDARIAVYKQYGIDTANLTAEFELKKKEIIDYYEQMRSEALEEMRNDQMTAEEQELEQLKDYYDYYTELFKGHKEQLLLIEEWYASQRQAISERYKENEEEDNQNDEDDKEKEREEQIKAFVNSYGTLFTKIREKAGDTAAYVGIAFTEALNSASQIIGALQAGIDETTEEGFEKSKKYQIAQALIGMAQGILSAVSSAMTIPPPMGPIIGGINAGTVATVGAIQIANIKKQKYDNPTEISDSPVIPSLTALNAMGTPVSATTNIEGASTEGQVTDTRVYVLESDISNSQNNVKTTVAEATF